MKRFGICACFFFGGLLAAGLLARLGAGSLLPECPFHRLTGLWCSGCGSTRAVEAAAHGDFAGAFRANALLGPMVLFGFLLCVLPEKTAKPRLFWTAAGIVVLFWIVRNLPFFPFTALAPA